MGLALKALIHFSLGQRARIRVIANLQRCKRDSKPGASFSSRHSVHRIRRHVCTENRDTPLENCVCDDALSDSPRIREQHRADWD
jgi:hypothetical protein